MQGFTWSSVGETVLHAVLVFVLNPTLYLGLLFTVLERQRLAKSERKFFGVRVTRRFRPLLRQLLIGISAGIVISVLSLAFGMILSPWEIWTLAIGSVVCSVIQLRYFSTYYIIALLALASACARWLPPDISGGYAAKVIRTLSSVHLDSLIMLAALALLAEAALLWSLRNRNASPAVSLGKRGHSIGGFLIQLSFCVPVIVFTNGSRFTIVNHSFLQGLHLGAVPFAFSFLALPLWVGHGALTTVQYPRNYVSALARFNVWLGATSILLSFAIRYVSVDFTWVAVVVIIAGKEWLTLSVKVQELLSEPIFVTTQQGIRVLATQPYSLAETLGIESGEVITHINQVPVHTLYDLHFAFEQNPAYAKLQVLDRRGEVRIIGGAVYTGEKNKLGIVMTPDTRMPYGYRPMVGGLFQTLYLRMKPVGTKPIGTQTGARGEPTNPLSSS